MSEYKNPPENAFANRAMSEGWQVSKTGWPDFFCVHENGATMAVEVKPVSKRKGRRVGLKASQIRRLSWMQSFGIDCYVSIAENLVPFVESDEWEIFMRNNGSKAQTRRDKTV